MITNYRLFNPDDIALGAGEVDLQLVQHRDGLHLTGHIVHVATAEITVCRVELDLGNDTLRPQTRPANQHLSRNDTFSCSIDVQLKGFTCAT